MSEVQNIPSSDPAETNPSLSSDPDAWCRCGESLVSAANRLAEPISPSHQAVAMMLLGMGIECYLKGLVIREDGYQPKGHNLVRLANLAQLELTPRAIDFLSDLTEMNQLGRYPVHRNQSVEDIDPNAFDPAIIAEVLNAIKSKLA
jgi:hypothetical protein